MNMTESLGIPLLFGDSPDNQGAEAAVMRPLSCRDSPARPPLCEVGPLLLCRGLTSPPWWSSDPEARPFVLCGRLCALVVHCPASTCGGSAGVLSQSGSSGPGQDEPQFPRRQGVTLRPQPWRPCLWARRGAIPHSDGLVPQGACGAHRRSWKPGVSGGHHGV